MDLFDMIQQAAKKLRKMQNTVVRIKKLDRFAHKIFWQRRFIRIALITNAVLLFAALGSGKGGAPEIFIGFVASYLLGRLHGQANSKLGKAIELLHKNRLLL